MSFEIQAARHPQRLNAESWMTTGVFYASLSAVFLEQAGFRYTPASWLDGILVLTACAATMFSLARRTPFQNVLLATVVIVPGGALAGLLSVRVLHLNIAPAPGSRLLPWWMPCLPVIAILASRGVALYLLGRRQDSPRFGWEVLALSAVLSSLLEFGAGSYLQAQGYWTVSSRAVVPSLAMCLLATLLLLVITTPMLINKKPIPERPDFHPLLIYAPLLILFLAKSLR